MNKNALLRFINKYTLGGEIKSVKWSSDGTSLSTRFISGDKSLVGSVKLDKVKDIDPSDVGVYNTSQLVALLNIAEINPELVEKYSQKLSNLPRGENRSLPLPEILRDPDLFGGKEDRIPWVEKAFENAETK